MEILVTGAGGKIGLPLTKELAIDHQVTATVRNLDSFPQLDSVRPVELDITDHQRLGQLFTETKFDAVLHLAAVTNKEANQDSETSRQRAIDVNVGGTRALAELACQYGVSRFVNVSSGLARQIRHDPDNSNHYGRTKLWAEQELDKIAAEATETSFLSQELENVYGDGLTQSLVNRLLSGESFELFRQFRRDYIHLSSAIEAMILALKSNKLVPGEHQVIEVGTGVDRSIEEVVEAVEQKGWPINAHWTTKDTPASSSRADTRLARELIGFDPPTELVIPDYIGQLALASS